MKAALIYGLIVSTGHMVAWFFFCLSRSKHYARYGMTLRKYMRGGFPGALRGSILMFGAFVLMGWFGLFK